ncbi:MAG: NAD(P)H-dependent glycerol-3-phosphate dehydrogenase [Pseudomonadota bacterium]
MNSFTRFAIIGTGSWGTALAVALHRAGLTVSMWGRDESIANALSSGSGNPTYLPDIDLPAIRADTNPAILAENDAILSVVPAQKTRDILQRAAPYIDSDKPILVCAKGIEQASLQFMTDVVGEAIPTAVPAVLSGPSFAEDVARGLPTAVTLACEDEELGQALTKAIGQPSFRPYWTDDVIGAQIGGALKNVLAISCGIVEGLELGRSAHAALLSRGFAEMRRLALAMGAQETTLSGLSGLGDLVLTCSSTQSRNMSFGLALGKGASAPELLSSQTSVVEGAATASAIVQLANQYSIDMPISQSVYDILKGNLTVERAITSLLERPFKGEI